MVFTNYIYFEIKNKSALWPNLSSSTSYETDSHFVSYTLTYPRGKYQLASLETITCLYVYYHIYLVTKN